MNKGQFLGTNVGVNQVVQRAYETGDKRLVAVDLAGMPLIFPTHGGALQNSFGIGGKIFEGDLCEFDLTNKKLYVLKTFEVAKAVTTTDTEVLIVRNGFRHLPEAMTVLMKSPSSLTGTGTAGAIGAVTETTYVDGANTIDVWSVEIAAGALGALAKGDILVEGAEAGTGKKALVTNPNSFFPNDITFNYPVVKGNDPFTGSLILFTPILRGVYWIKAMRPLPASVLAKNESKFPEWFMFKF